MLLALALCLELFSTKKCKKRREKFCPKKEDAANILLFYIVACGLWKCLSHCGTFESRWLLSEHYKTLNFF